jgi:two-component system, OmpR family, phosphate regulon response regulator PhoB
MQDGVLFARLVVEINVHMPVNEQTPATVLVVEDDDALRMLCRINLDLEGYRVLEAETIDQAAGLLSKEAVDVVLLDLHVGDRHGLELLPTLRAEHPRTSVCLLSGTSEADPPEAEGVNEFIRKPFELDVLTDTVRRLAARPVRR